MADKYPTDDKNDQQLLSAILNISQTMAQNSSEILVTADQVLNQIPIKYKEKFRPITKDDVRNVQDDESPAASYWRRTLMDLTGKFILNFKKKKIKDLNFFFFNL